MLGKFPITHFIINSYYYEMKLFWGPFENLIEIFELYIKFSMGATHYYCYCFDMNWMPLARAESSCSSSENNNYNLIVNLKWQFVLQNSHDLLNTQPNTHSLRLAGIDTMRLYAFPTKSAGNSTEYRVFAQREIPRIKTGRQREQRPLSIRFLLQCAKFHYSLISL